MRGGEGSGDRRSPIPPIFEDEVWICRLWGCAKRERFGGKMICLSTGYDRLSVNRPEPSNRRSRRIANGDGAKKTQRSSTKVDSTTCKHIRALLCGVELHYSTRLARVHCGVATSFLLPPLDLRLFRRRSKNNVRNNGYNQAHPPPSSPQRQRQRQR